MAISFHIDKVNRRIYSKAEGLVTFEDLIGHLRSEIGSETASYSEIFDCSGATTNLTVDQVRRLAEERRNIARDHEAGPAAVVATNDLFFGMFRVFDMLTETVRPLRVFRDMKSAEAWLDAVEAGGPSDPTLGEAPQFPKIPK